MWLSDRTDRDWQKWGTDDPYFGVLSDPKLMKANLNDDALSEFFLSGERHIDHVFRAIRAGVAPIFDPARALDYGCGVGRLVIPLASRTQTVVGVDVSPGMLDQARQNCRRLGISSISLLHVDEMASLQPGSFDFVHSFIVFQHIPVTRGEQMLHTLIALLVEGGIGAIHVTYCSTRKPFRRFGSALRKRVGLVHGILNLAQHLPYSTPLIPVYSYSIKRIFNILIDEGGSNVHLEFFRTPWHTGRDVLFPKVQKSSPLTVRLGSRFLDLATCRPR